MDLLEECSQQVDGLTSELLMRQIDRDLSLVFYDMTKISTHGLSEQIEDLRAYRKSKKSVINRQMRLGVV